MFLIMVSSFPWWSPFGEPWEWQANPHGIHGCWPPSGRGVIGCLNSFMESVLALGAATDARDAPLARLSNHNTNTTTNTTNNL